MIVRVQRPIDFTNSAGALFSVVDLERAILENTIMPVAKTKDVFMHGKYPAISIHGKKWHIHRLLMKFYTARDIGNTMYVHHRNGNKLDARRENLELFDGRMHQSLHNKGRKQSRSHIVKRINATSMTRYGHAVYENPDLLKQQPK